MPAADEELKKKAKAAGERKNEAQPCGAGEVKCILGMENNVVHPADLMHPLCMAMAWHTKKPVAASIGDIRLYAVYDLGDDSFLGSFYALEHDGMYYGNIVGSLKIFTCKTDAFRFEETDELFVPLRNDGKNIFVLMCCYERFKLRLTTKSLKKFDSQMQNGKILREFADGTLFDKAYSECQSLIN